MKYIGPFLRINTLSKSNIENQLFHLSKESIKHIVLSSKCGIVLPTKELKMRNIPNIDISTFSSFSPLLCIYKKANPKLLFTENSIDWDEESFKKEIPIRSNAFMTLCLLELSEYYRNLEDIDTEKSSLGFFYLSLCKKQLEFYASYLRNEEGVFIDKTDLSSPLASELVFEEKNKKFHFSDQALLMAAFYKYSSLTTKKDCEEYHNFALSILNMFVTFKDDLYLLPFEELNKLCFALNIFLEYSKMEEAKLLLLDISEFIVEQYGDETTLNAKNKIENQSLLFLNLMMLYENTSILKFKDCASTILDTLLESYSPELGLFLKESEKKELEFSSDEIVLYLLSLLMHAKDTNNNNDDIIIVDIFKRQLLNSGIILSWPEAPSLHDVERYREYTLKSEDLIEEQDYKMVTIPTPETAEYAPIFIKNVTYNRKKETFKQEKLTFDSNKNMYIFFLLLHFLKK